MKHANKRRDSSILLVTGLITVFAGTAMAGSGQQAGPGPAIDCPRLAAAPASPELMKKRQTFFDRTVELRRKLMARRTELRAVMRADNPDPARASALAAEIFDLREQLRKTARELDLPPRFWQGNGHHGPRNPLSGGHGPHHARRLAPPEQHDNSTT